jgi:hypothetical protein
MGGFMGLAKQHLGELEEKRAVALRILIEAGALQYCEFHDDVILEGHAEIEDAYKLGNSKWEELKDWFESRREMTDAMKSAYEDNCAEECYSCRKWQAE